MVLHSPRLRLKPRRRARRRRARRHRARRHRARRRRRRCGFSLRQGQPDRGHLVGETPSVQGDSGGKRTEPGETVSGPGRGRGEAPVSMRAAQGPPWSTSLSSSSSVFNFIFSHLLAFAAAWLASSWPSLSQLPQPPAPQPRAPLGTSFRGDRLLSPHVRLFLRPPCACEGCRSRPRAPRRRVCLGLWGSLDRRVGAWAGRSSESITVPDGPIRRSSRRCDSR